MAGAPRCRGPAAGGSLRRIRRRTVRRRQPRIRLRGPSLSTPKPDYGRRRAPVLAVRLHRDGLNVEEIEAPSPRPGEVLVRVRAAAITRGELEWPVDRLPAIPSYELSGVLVGSGDEVYALTPFDH